MKQVIADFIGSKNPQSLYEYDRALREILQHIALLGLGRAGFFEHAAFYGGTALRIIHGLPRFSEDIDFTLLKTTPEFSLGSYLSGLKTELAGFGFDTEVAAVEKKSSTVESAFIKANTRAHILSVSPSAALAGAVPSNQLIKVKLEVDTDPPGNFSTEAVPLLFPLPFYLRVCSLPDLFAGKMHCVLYRTWRKRVKGRDWYDMIWFLRRGEPLHLAHLEERMCQSGDWVGRRELRKEDFLDLYRKRVENTDFSQAVSDVLPFIEDPRELDVWGRDFFLTLAGKFQFV
jgi:hypothetical protein